MNLHSFFGQVPTLRMQDPLARLLGGADNGILEYSYADAVKLAGHSCPTVAAAYWLTWLAMEKLYPDTLPQRGSVRVDLREDARTGSTGVVVTVIQMLTGAAGSTGFKGLFGRFGRAGLIRHSPDLLLSMRFTRVDTREAVEAASDLSLVPPSAAMERLLERCVQGKGTRDEEAQLAQLWQERVRHLLLDLARDPGVFVVRPAERQRFPLAAGFGGWNRRDEPAAG